MNLTVFCTCNGDDCPLTQSPDFNGLLNSFMINDFKNKNAASFEAASNSMGCFQGASELASDVFFSGFGLSLLSEAGLSEGVSAFSGLLPLLDRTEDDFPDLLSVA